MTDYSNFTQEQIDAERAALAMERAALEAARNGEKVVELPELAQALADQAENGAVRELYETIAEETEDKPEPWPHQHMVYEGLELEVRIPNQSALMAISMLQQLDGQGELQMEVFNSFLANHLSPSSLAKVAMEMMRPETKVTMQGLVQALVALRTGSSDNS